jgi:hypothetical protein
MLLLIQFLQEHRVELVCKISALGFFLSLCLAICCGSRCLLPKLYRPGIFALEFFLIVVVGVALVILALLAHITAVGFGVVFVQIVFFVATAVAAT